MKDQNLSFQGISKNLKYIFTNRGIYDMVNEKTMKYSSISLSEGIKMVQEVQTFEYKSGQIGLQEHLSNPRRAIISLSEIFFPEQQVMVLSEWEQHFGSKLLILNESTDTLLLESKINQAWDGVSVIIEGIWDYIKSGASSAWEGVKSGAKWVGDKVSQGWNWIKEKAMAAWKCLTNNFVECLMEGLRSALMSIVGISIEVFLSSTGVGAPIPMILWGLMLVWDVYKMFSGKYESGEYQWGWMDIIIDIISMATAGFATGILAGLKTAGKGVKTAEAAIEIGVKKGGAIGKIFSGIGKTISGVLGKVMGYVRSGAKWVAEKFGIKWLGKWASKAETVVAKVVETTTKKGGVKASTELVKTGEKKLGTFGKIKKGYNNAIDKTVGNLGKGKTVLGSDLNKSLKTTLGTALPVGVGLHAFGINPWTGTPYKSQEEKNQTELAQKDTEELEKNVSSLTTGTADYETSGAL
jgi:hypothetical protein